MTGHDQSNDTYPRWVVLWNSVSDPNTDSLPRDAAMTIVGLVNSVSDPNTAIPVCSAAIRREPVVIAVEMRLIAQLAIELDGWRIRGQNLQAGSHRAPLARPVEE